MITVTASDGRMKTAKIDEGMPRHETLAKMLLLRMHREAYPRPDNVKGCRREMRLTVWATAAPLADGTAFPTVGDTHRPCDGIPGWRVSPFGKSINSCDFHLFSASAGGAFGTPWL
jgi:hypothetical protein